jgi:hypothetical protein
MKKSPDKILSGDFAFNRQTIIFQKRSSRMSACILINKQIGYPSRDSREEFIKEIISLNNDIVISDCLIPVYPYLLKDLFRWITENKIDYASRLELIASKKAFGRTAYSISFSFPVYNSAAMVNIQIYETEDSFSAQFIIDQYVSLEKAKEIKNLIENHYTGFSFKVMID